MSTRKEETRIRLLDAARKLLLERGFHHVSLETVAEAAGVSRQAVYKSHFASKADLLLALVRHVDVTERLGELAAPIGAARTGIAMLEETLRASVRIQARVHALSLALAAAATSDEAAAAAWRDRTEVRRGAIHAALRRVEAEGRLDASWTIEEAVDVVALLASAEAYQQLVVERGWAPEAVVERAMQLCGAFLTA